MSYDIVRGIKLVQNEDNTWYAIITSASNNVAPRHYYKWNYCKDKGLTKEQLESEIMFDYYKGNFKGGQNKYNQYLKFLGGSWGVYSNDSRATQVYIHFDTKIDKLYKLPKTEKRDKLMDKAHELREKRTLEEFKKEIISYSDKIDECVLKVGGDYVKFNRTNGYYTDKKHATVFISKSRLQNLRNRFTRCGYTTEIEVI